MRTARPGVIPALPGNGPGPSYIASTFKSIHAVHCAVPTAPTDSGFCVLVLPGLEVCLPPRIAELKRSLCVGIFSAMCPRRRPKAHKTESSCSFCQPIRAFSGFHPRLGPPGRARYGKLDHQGPCRPHRSAQNFRIGLPFLGTAQSHFFLRYPARA